MINFSKSKRFRVVYNVAWYRGLFLGMLSVLVGFLFLVYATGCGSYATFAAAEGATPLTCKVEQQTTGAMISCPDGSTAFVSNGSTSCTCDKKKCHE